MQTTNSDVESITHIWERFNLKWIIAGVAAAIIAGFLVAFLAGSFTQKAYGDFYLPFKLIGATCHGSNSLALGPLGSGGQAGIMIHLALCTLFGVTFAQLVNEKSKPLSLIILGLVTSFVIWVFGCKLFMPAFNRYLNAYLPTSTGLYLHLFFGLLFALILIALRPILVKK